MGQNRRRPCLRQGYRLLIGTLAAALAALPLPSLPASSSAASGGAAAGVSAGGDRRPVAVVDDTGRAVSLARPARRVVALSPALVEMVYELGAGDRLVGVVTHSDWPPAARALPRVGDALALGVEAVLAREPDLVLAWEGGNLAAPVDRLAGLGLPVYRSRIDRLEGIGTTLTRLGALLGASPDEALARFRAGLAALSMPAGPLPERPASGGRPARPGLDAPVRVFYQVWAEPPMTINGRHVISDIISRCGGINVFADALPAAPTVSVEAVVAAAPELMVAGSPRPDDPADDPFAGWRRFPAIPAVAAGRLLVLDADRVARPTSRMLEAAGRICAAIESVRR